MVNTVAPGRAPRYLQGRMESLAVGFWGAYFGTVGLLLFAALMAFQRSAQRVALTCAMSALVSGVYPLIFLGWLPLRGDWLMRAQAQAGALSAGFLGMFLFAMLGHLRDRRRAARGITAMSAATALVLAVGWMLSPQLALLLANGMEAVVIGITFAAALRSALRGARMAWLAVAGVGCMTAMVAGLTWHAFAPQQVPWYAHAAAALAGIAYVTIIASALWVRYSYLIGLREVMTHGPSFDPITRMRSHAETGLMLGEAFSRKQGDRRPVGVIVISIGNFSLVERLHGRAAYNHALFMCASRLRRTVTPDVEMGRLSEDGFLLLLRDPDNGATLIALAQRIAARLSKPVELGTSQNLAEIEARHTQWKAQIGVGLLVAGPDLRPAEAVARARAMSRTAWTYPSRIAWHDNDSGQIAELPGDEFETAPARV